MLADISSVDAIYIVCGRTDMRKSIDGLCAIIQEQFSMEIDHALFLFCGRRCDRIKAILKEPDGIVMIYKRLTAQGSYRLNNPVPVSLLSGDRKPQIRFLGNHPSGSGNLYHKSFRM